MNSERMDAIKNVMTPEQKERFDKQLERMKNRMPPGPPGGGGPGGPPPGM
jgi:Spy/CpxP family protein refolding chaperone